MKNSLLEGYDDGRDCVSAKRIVHSSICASTYSLTKVSSGITEARM